LKPENILLDKHFQIKLADFGFAYAYMKNGEISNMRTELGTRGYMAPEIARTHSYDHKVDFFAAGVILFILLSGFPPFKQTENTDWWFDKIDKGKNNLFWMAHERKVSFSGPAKALIDGLLCTDPTRRFDMEQIEASKFLQEDNEMQREEFAREMKNRYKAVVQGKQGKQRDDSNLEATLDEHADIDIFGFDFLIQNSFREKLLACEDAGTFEEILEEIKESTNEATKMCLEKNDPQFAGAETCQALGLAEGADVVATALGIQPAFAGEIFGLMTDTKYGEIEKYAEAKQFVQLEGVDLPVFEEDYHNGFSGVFNIRCGMGTVAYALQEFLKENNGDFEVDMDNRKLIYLFPVESQGYLPEGDGFVEYVETINIVIQINFYSGGKYNKMVVSRFGTDLSGSEQASELMSRLQRQPTLAKLIVHTEENETEEN